MIDVSRERALVELLAAGEERSASDIASHLAIATGQVSQMIRELAKKGLEFVVYDDRAYQLARPFELLQAEKLRAALAENVGARVPDIEVLWSTDSTNTRLLEKPAPQPGQVRVCLAEFQTTGRGRLQRSWHAPLGGGLCMSVSWPLEKMTEALATAGLVTGVAVRDALEKCGVQGLQLKWPNDLVRENRKLGGLLLEVRGEAGRGTAPAAKLIIGIGLNYFLNATARAKVGILGGLLPGDIVEASDREPGRNVLAAAVLAELLPALSLFAENGFEPFANAWRAADACKDAPVVVTTQSQKLTGVARGIDASGALQLDVDGKITSIVSAQVCMRPS